MQTSSLEGKHATNRLGNSSNDIYTIIRPFQKQREKAWSPEEEKEVEEREEVTRTSLISSAEAVSLNWKSTIWMTAIFFVFMC